MRRLFLLLYSLIFCYTLVAQSSRVLFLGNSYTYVNNLPQLVQQCCQSVGDDVIVNMSTSGGLTFQQHCTFSLGFIMSGDYDIVVLQEQSQLPSFPESQFMQDSYPYAQQLCDLIHQYNPDAKIYFYMTWGRKNGDAQNCQNFPPLCTYEGMDSLLYDRYMVMAADNQACVSPVGAVWHYIRDNYPDMELYQASREALLRSRALFSNIYKELNRESKNFSPGLIEEKSKTRDFATAIQWLTMAHIVHQSFQLKEHITMPLMPDDEGSFRLFLCDIGMFSYQSGINAASFVSTDRENTLSGIFFENFIANELAAKGHKLYYWKGKSSSELEFIVESDNKLYPIDVKKGRGTLNSLDKFTNHNRYEIAIKVSRNNYGFDSEYGRYFKKENERCFW